MDDLGEYADVAPWEQRSFDGMLDRCALDVDRVGPKQSVAHCGAHEIPEQPVDLGHCVPVEAGVDELTVPCAHVARRDRRKLDIAEAGEDVAQLRLVGLAGVGSLIRSDLAGTSYGSVESG